MQFFKRRRNNTMTILKPALILASLVAMAACSTTPNGIRVTKDGTSATSSKQGATIRDLSAAEIGQVVIGKSFQYTRSNGTGFVTYNPDGSLSITDDQKGVGKLVEMAVELGLKARPDLKLGVCGEHGGDPASKIGRAHV